MFAALLGALGRVATRCPLMLPAHPRVAPHLRNIDLPAGIRVIDPLSYLEFLALEASARLVLTDSGGVQEETTALGVPCLTLRDTTERPITITEGTNVLVGRDPDRIVAEAERVLRDGMAARRPVLWDGNAGERIGAVLVDGHPFSPVRCAEPRPRSRRGSAKRSESTTVDDCPDDKLPTLDPESHSAFGASDGREERDLKVASRRA